MILCSRLVRQVARPRMMSAALRKQSSQPHVGPPPLGPAPPMGQAPSTGFRSIVEEMQELRLTSGKLFAAELVGGGGSKLGRKSAAVAFPELSTVDVEARETPLPAGLERRVTLVTICGRKISSSALLSWIEPFAHHVRSSSFANEHTNMVQISLVDNTWLRVFRSWLLADMRRAETSRSVQYTSLLHIGGAEAFRAALGITNRLVGYVFLVDHRGVVRFRATGDATEEELDLLFQRTRDLVAEREHDLSAGHQ